MKESMRTRMKLRKRTTRREDASKDVGEGALHELEGYLKWRNSIRIQSHQAKAQLKGT